MVCGLSQCIARDGEYNGDWFLLDQFAPAPTRLKQKRLAQLALHTRQQRVIVTHDQQLWSEPLLIYPVAGECC